MYEGKAKKVFATDNEDYCIVSYKDDATAFNGEKKGTIVGKGVVNNRMSNFMFKLLEAKGFLLILSRNSTTVRLFSKRLRSFLSRLSSAIRRRVLSQNASVFPRVLSLNAPHSSSVLRTTTLATP